MIVFASYLVCIELVVLSIMVWMEDQLQICDWIGDSVGSERNRPTQHNVDCVAFLNWR